MTAQAARAAAADMAQRHRQAEIAAALLHKRCLARADAGRSLISALQAQRDAAVGRAATDADAGLEQAAAAHAEEVLAEALPALKALCAESSAAESALRQAAKEASGVGGVTCPKFPGMLPMSQRAVCSLHES